MFQFVFIWMKVNFLCVWIVPTNSLTLNCQMACIIVLMYKVFFLKVLFMPIQMLQNVFERVSLEKLKYGAIK